MAIKEGFDYIDISWRYVKNKLSSLIASEYNHKAYVAPEKIPSKSPFRLNKLNVEPEETGQDDWRKLFEVEIFYYIEIDEDERGYQHLYSESEHLYQLIHNNQVTPEQVNWIDGKIEETVIEKLSDGLYSINLLFSCIVYKSLFLEEKALEYDAVDDFIQIKNFVYDFYNDGNTKPFTMSAWIKLADKNFTASSGGAAFNESGYQTGFQFTYNVTFDQIRITGQTGGVGENGMKQGWEFFMPLDSDWHHILWTVHTRSILLDDLIRCTHW